MGAILIQADSQSNKMLSDLAKKLGANVLSIKMHYGGGPKQRFLNRRCTQIGMVDEGLA